jgi:hypothetical protein
MYIVAIAWMYVVVLMAATQASVLAALGTLIFYGILPCSVVMYVIMAPTRRRRKQALEAAQQGNLPANSKPTNLVPLPSQTDP